MVKTKKVRAKRQARALAFVERTLNRLGAVPVIQPAARGRGWHVTLLCRGDVIGQGFAVHLDDALESSARSATRKRGG